MALKGILKNSGGASAEAGPSRPKSAPTASIKASVAAPVAKDTRTTKGSQSKRKIEQAESEDDGADNEDDSMGEDDWNTDDEIEAANAPGEKKALKRKRVTTAADFGSTLTSLLAEPSVTKKSKKSKKQPKAAEAESDSDAASVDLTRPAAGAILGLSAKPLPPSRAAVSLERRAARQLKAEKADRLDRARVRDVLEGWVPAEGANVGSQEFERGLRKTAQRGVIKLFNAILVASRNAEAAAVTLSQKAGVKPEAPKSRKEKDNVLGRGSRGEDVLTKESFLDLVRKGGAK